MFFDQTEPIAVLPLFPLNPQSPSPIQSVQSNQSSNHPIIQSTLSSPRNSKLSDPFSLVNLLSSIVMSHYCMATPTMICPVISPGCLPLSVNFLDNDAQIVVMLMLSFPAMVGSNAPSSPLRIVPACGPLTTRLSKVLQMVEPQRLPLVWTLPRQISVSVNSVRSSKT